MSSLPSRSAAPAPATTAAPLPPVSTATPGASAITAGTAAGLAAPSASIGPALGHASVLLAALAALSRHDDLFLAGLATWLAWATTLTVHFAWPARPLARHPAARGETTSGPRRAPAWRRVVVVFWRHLQRALRTMVLPIGALGTLALAAWTARMLLATAALPPASPAAGAVPRGSLAVLLVLAAFLGFFLQTYAALRSRRAAQFAWPERLAAALVRATTLLCAAGAALLFASDRLGLQMAVPAATALLALAGAGMGETGLRAAARLYQPASVARLLPPLGGGWVLFPLLTRDERRAWRQPLQADAPSLALADMWFLPTLRRLLLPLAAAVALLVWLGTTIHEVPHGSVGLWARFGRVQDAPLAAGFHFTLPYPLHEVRLVAQDRLERVVLGLEADTGAPLLWDRAHYIGEQAELVGGGEELLTISVPIYYHVADAAAFQRHTGDAARVIRDLGYQVLLDETLQRPAFAIMTTDRPALAAALHTRLQAELDRRQTGLSVAMVCLRDIHPPVQVGPAYQDVVSALEDREAFAHHGETYRAENLPRARSDAAKLRSNADADLGTRTARAVGEASRFSALLASYQTNPDVFRLRQTYAVYDDSLRGVKKLLVDESFRGRVPTLVDVRRTLNPDFAPPPTPFVPSLIPSLAEKPAAFDRAIDGYLQMGRGAIPSVTVVPHHPDNLLDAPAPRPAPAAPSSAPPAQP